MKYRLYTEKVRKGFIKSEDAKYEIIKTKISDGRFIALIRDDCQFIVGVALKYYEHDSIDWAHGHYFWEQKNAEEKFMSYIED